MTEGYRRDLVHVPELLSDIADCLKDLEAQHRNGRGFYDGGPNGDVV